MALELKGTIIGRIRSYGVKADNTNDGKTATVDIDVVLSEEEALEFGGPLFAKTCFSDYVESSALATVKNKTLAGELAIKAEHTLELDGFTLVTKPKITGLELSEKERSVTITLRLQIPGSAMKVRRMIDESCGDRCKVLVKGVTQPEIPGSKDDTRHGFEGTEGAEQANV